MFMNNNDPICMEGNDVDSLPNLTSPARPRASLTFSRYTTDETFHLAHDKNTTPERIRQLHACDCLDWEEAGEYWKREKQ